MDFKNNKIVGKQISAVCYYENPILKKDRDWKSYWKYFWKNPFKFPKKTNPLEHFDYIFPNAKVFIGNHHLSHLNIHTLPQILMNQHTISRWCW